MGSLQVRRTQVSTSLLPHYRYTQKGYSWNSGLVSRILKPSDNWEKTSGARALNAEKINAAFSDNLYNVTPPTEKKNTDDLTTQEKRTEL